MIIERLDLKAFGRFTDTSIQLPDGPRRLHIIYGPNESGKSTSLRAITSLLYGMSKRAEDNYIHPTGKIRVGGKLSDGNGNVLECLRRRGNKATLRDADDNETIDDAVLDAMLGGVDREAFEHRFGLSHEELVRGGQAILEGEGDLGEILFAAGAGVSQLKTVQSQLDDLAGKLFVAGGTRGAINQLSREIAEKRKELELAKIPPSDFNDLKDELDRECQRVDELQNGVKEAAVALSKLRAVKSALPLIPQWHSLLQKLDELADAPRLDDAFSERRRTVDTHHEISLRQTRSLSTRVDELTKQLKSLGDDSAILVHEAQIDSLFQRLGAREEARTQRTNLQRTRKNLDRRMVEALQELSVEIVSQEEQAVTDEIDSSLKKLRVVDSVRTKLNDLAQQYAVIAKQRDDADESLRSLTKRLAEADEQVKETIVPDDPYSISQLIESVGSPDSVLSNLAQQKSDVKQLHNRCEQLARKLDTFCSPIVSSGDTTAASFADSFHDTARLRLPVESAIESAVQNLEKREQQLAAVTQQWKQLDTTERELQQRLDAVQSVTTLPSEEQLGEARERRDAIFCDVIAANQAGTLDTKTLTQLQAEIRKADTLVDAMRSHHEQLHLQSSIEEELKKTANQKTLCQTNGEAAKAAFQEAQQQWQSLWEASGVTPTTPDRMYRWITAHAQLVETTIRLDEARERVGQLEERIAASCKRLNHAIESAVVDKPVLVGSDEPSLFDQIDANDFSSLYDDAVNLRTTLHHARKRYDEQLKQHDMMREELPRLQTQLESRQRDYDTWHSDWAAATSALAESVDRTPAVVLEKITQIDALCAQKRERDILAHRIRSMLEDDKTYQKDVARLAAELGVKIEEKEGDVSDAFSTVKQLYNRLQNERAASQQRGVLATQLASTEKQLETAEQQVTEAEVAIQKLCEEAGCDAAEELVEVEQRSKQRQQFEQSKQAIEEQLRMLSGTVELEAFAEEVAEHQPELVQIEIEKIEADLADNQDSLSEAQQTVGALRLRLKQIDGSDRASELSQSIQFLTGKMENAIEEFARVKVAAMMLRQAIEHYRQENQGPVLQLASTIFQQLTRDEYDSLKVDFDSRGKVMLFGTRTRSGEPDVPANAMSTGTADALYLALRLASIDHQLTRGTALPLVVDDCLVQLDDDRACAAITALSELSARTQVIMFTHHEHLVDLAEKTLKTGEFHVHRLDAECLT